MKLSILVLACVSVFFFVNDLSAQTREDIQPLSFSTSSRLLGEPAVRTFSFDAAAAASRDTREDKLGHMPRFAHMIGADINMVTSGTWTELPNGDGIWRCRISSPGALGLLLCYDMFHLPEGASLHIYTPQRDEVIGAFTSANNPASGYYNTGLVHGSECIIEYDEPAASRGRGQLHIYGVGHAYRMVPGYKASRDFGTSASCEVNVACPEGRLTQDQKNAVVRILVKTGTDFGWCSGTLMNNTSQNCAPLILSADHCYQDENNGYTAASTADLNQWVFYFNYESSTCANPSAEGTLGNHTVTGCTFKAASLDNGGTNGSDFVLIQASHSVPLTYRPYYAGWNSNNLPAHAGVSIHHPDGDIKKVSTYAASLVSSHWGNFTFDTHWDVEWAQTLTGTGVTEPGSSGSPIFDFSNRVVGTLTGGISSCTLPTAHDRYGKLSYHWTSDGLTSNQQLKPWLDPGNTGTTIFDGQYAPCSPTLSFDAAVMAILQSGPVCDQSVALTATLVNYGNQQLTEDSLTFTIDGGSPQTLFWSGALNPLESDQVSLPAQNLPIGDHTITIASSAPDGNVDGNTANDSKTSTFTVYPAAGHYTFTLQTSDRGSNVSWELIDANNMIAYAGGPYTNTNQTITQSWCLPVGCYTFTVFNSSSLGLKGIITDGTYNIEDNNGSSVAALRNVNFGAQESTNNICSSAVAGVADLPALSGITIYPNPSSGTYMITHTTDITSLVITDALGRTISTAAMRGEQARQVDLGAQESGVYFFHLTSDQGSITKKVILTREK
ncbi:MAG: Lysyl endopeptidase [Bacteroidetes bacterium]|nr:Lysyl endopeptidase [Bacteroidota bacterium]